MRRRNFDITLIIFVFLLLASSLRNGGFSDPLEWLKYKLLLLPGIAIGLSLHEYAHAVVAYKLGDVTPKIQGRVTINPLAHVDWVGLAALIFCGFGWGIPVEINPYNFRKQRKGQIMVALAGVTMNLAVAVIVALIAKVLLIFFGSSFVNTAFGSAIWLILIYTIRINLVLMIFNLIPCPPLDGFNLIVQIFRIPSSTYWGIMRYGNLILIGLIIFGITSRIISPCVDVLFNLLWMIITM